jgi:hypothetical protein
MQMVFYPIDPVEEAVFVFYKPRDVGIEFPGMEWIEGLPAVFCPEDQVIQYLTIA